MDKEIGQTIKILMGSLILISLVFMLRRHLLPPQIPLFYSLPEGEEQIADYLTIFVLPTISLLTVVLNNFLTAKYFSNDEFIQRIVYYVNLILIGIVTFIFIKIVFLVS